MQKILLTAFFIYFFNSSESKNIGFSNKTNLPILKSVDTLHLLISSANDVYYYFNNLEEDVSNFKVTTSKGIRDVIKYYKSESAKNDEVLLILLKIEKNASLNNDTRNFIDFIKQDPNYKIIELSETEKILIKLHKKALKEG